jgi:hypothetical protein
VVEVNDIGLGGLARREEPGPADDLSVVRGVVEVEQDPIRHALLVLEGRWHRVGDGHGICSSRHAASADE